MGMMKSTLWAEGEFSAPGEDKGRYGSWGSLKEVLWGHENVPPDRKFGWTWGLCPLRREA